METVLTWLPLVGGGIGVLAAVLALALWISLGRTKDRLARTEQVLAKAVDRQRRFEDTVLPAAPDQAGESPRSLPEVLAEVRVLQNLVEQLYQDQPEGGGAFEDVHDEGLGDAVEDHDRPPPSDATILAQVGEGRPAPARKVGATEKKILAAVREALKKDRVELMVQPIVLLPARRPRHYECLSRIRGPEGELLEPAQFLPIAEKAGLIAGIDNMTLFRIVQLIRRSRKLHPESRFFCNISQVSLADDAFFEQFIDYLAQNKALAQMVVFEFNQRDFQAGNLKAAESIKRLAELGYRFSLDQIEDLDIDPEAMSRFGFKYVKMDARRLLEYANHEPPLLDVSILKGELDRQAMDLICDKIEDEATMRELLDHPVDFGQGYLFGQPKAVGA
ncbi:MAG: EAL domain-containing protein [Alphaproteobacteria bacterium]|nr:EAL domain-containing protein [Alphaproteobacteria bacterium]